MLAIAAGLLLLLPSAWRESCKSVCCHLAQRYIREDTGTQRNNATALSQSMGSPATIAQHAQHAGRPERLQLYHA